MTDFECDWIDAFTDQAFVGNGCAVVYEKTDCPMKFAAHL
jgi:predicted PhzF superfamily epimerase YddE/YHI9